ncbi:MAG: hypothetical protein XD40_2340 [Archaeoglobus fulgidus]|uniref:Uncharacterized protein n=1 Tax=Archaeoglobus fulgidus TaxID=2234 RepID=A0A124F7S4_ARCFL|nr:hypothetical protein [Archaeoglobus fulgidus]KUJ92461.1 MAG: hypothetical protein XD40_2340 [Archaeoglobus fulgidus]KUK05503.1 MAG: Uncharacterized protein XD48_2258 [Archaeoglobus fulgidus]
MDTRLIAIATFVVTFGILIVLKRLNYIESWDTFSILSILAAVLTIAAYFFTLVLFPQDYDQLKKEILDEINESLKNYEIYFKCKDFKKPIVKDGAVRIDKCVVMATKLNLTDHGYIVDLKFRSNWMDSKGTHAILFIDGDDAQTNLFEREGEIFYIIKSKNKISGVYIQLKSVKWFDEAFSDNWNNIKIMWDTSKDEIWLEINGIRVSKKLNFDFNLNDSVIYLGSNPLEDTYAEGYFDRIMVYKSADTADFGTPTVRRFE